MYDTEWLNIYLITNDYDKFDTHTHIGSVSDLMHRIDQHNGRAPGGPQDTKRAAGYWNIMFYMRIPPIRNFSCRDLVSTFNKKRGLDSRCKAMFKFATSTRSEFKISRLLIHESSKYYSEKITTLLLGKYPEDDLHSVLMD